MLIKRENHIKYKYGGVLKVNKRQEKIVLLLNDTKAWMTGKEISKLMQVSDRTIRSDIDAINRYYEQPIIESNLRSGYHNEDSFREAVGNRMAKYMEYSTKIYNTSNTSRKMCVYYTCVIV